MTEKKVLIVGGHGKVALLAIPKLVAAGFEVSGLIRNPEQQEDLRELGATPIVESVTELSQQRWQELAEEYDVLVWSAGNGGKAGPEQTYAIDQDAAIASMKAAAAVDQAPQYIMVSWAGTFSIPVKDEAKREGFDHYVAAKFHADEFLTKTAQESGLDYVILGPSTLTTAPAGGITVLPADVQLNEVSAKTSRELVADVVTYYAGQDSLPDAFVPFTDGPADLSTLPQA